MVNVDDILKKYSSSLAKKIPGNEYRVGDVSREYLQFKQDMMPNLSRYEKMARSFGGLLKVKPSKKDELRLGKNLGIAHLDITPSEVISFSFFGAFITFFIGLIIFLGVFFYVGSDFISYSFGPAGLFLFMVLIASMFVFYYIYSSPLRMSKLWRLKAGSQMVPCILYIVVYMKHTSNLERAIAFASQHLQAPLALDLRKIF